MFCPASLKAPSTLKITQGMYQFNFAPINSQNPSTGVVKYSGTSNAMEDTQNIAFIHILYPGCSPIKVIRMRQKFHSPPVLSEGSLSETYRILLYCSLM